MIVVGPGRERTRAHAKDRRGSRVPTPLDAVIVTGPGRGASDGVEHAADELRPYPSPLVRGVDLGVKHGEEAGLKVIVRIASERGADVRFVPPAPRVVANRDLFDPVWSG